MAACTVGSDFGGQEKKISHASTPPFYCYEVVEQGAMILVEF